MDYNPLTAFLEEAEETLVPSLAHSSAQVEDTECVTGDSDKVRTGYLLLTGCNDWESMTSQKPLGLDSPHLIKLKSPVANVFSSSNSAHFFLVLDSGELYGCGNNLRGQLGLNDKFTRPNPSMVSYSTFVGPKSSRTVVKVATGKAHTLLLMSDGIVYTTGAANFGQIGVSQNAGILTDREKFSKLSEDVQDVACGAEHSLYCTNTGELYSFGHPEYGVLGHGSSGEYFEEGGKKAGLSFNYTFNPKRVDTFLTKDSKGKIISENSSKSVKVTAVSAGKHHSACMLTLDNDNNETFSRVYTWGFGGFGRLGHNCADDELMPRELSFFSSLRTAVHQLTCGASYTCTISKQNQFYFWGKLPNSPRGESQMYPKPQQELYDFNVHSVAAGSQFIAIATEDSCLAWGRPVGGKFGLEEDSISSVNPKYIDSVKGLNIIKLSAGYGHLCFLVQDSGSGESRSKTDKDSFPVIPETGPITHSQKGVEKGKKCKQSSISPPIDDKKKRQKRR